MNCQFLFLSYVDDMQMYSDKFFNIYFHEQMFFQIFVAKADTVQFLLKK